MKKLIDPATRTSTAFYAALAVVSWDILKHGFSIYNAAILAALSGLGTLGALAALVGVVKPPTDPPPA